MTNASASLLGALWDLGQEGWVEVRHHHVHPFMLMCEPGEFLVSAEQFEVNKK